MTQKTQAEELLERLSTLTDRCHSVRTKLEEGEFPEIQHRTDLDRLRDELDVPLVETALLYSIEVVLESIEWSKKLATEMGCVDAIVALLEAES